MAKKTPRLSDGPSAAELLKPDELEASSNRPVAIASPAAVDTPRAAEWIQVRLPTAPYDERGCRPFHVEARLTARQQRGLQRLRNGLDLTPVRDALGRRPNTHADVVRWLLDQVATAAGEPPPPARG